MKKCFLYFIVALTFISCDKTIRVEYDGGKLHKVYNEDFFGRRNGLSEVYYPDGKLMLRSIYREGKLADSSLFYFKDGYTRAVYSNFKNDSAYCKVYKGKTFFTEGYTYKNRKTGLWKVFGENGALFKKEEYINLCGQQYLNQFWKYDLNSKVLFEKSNFFKTVYKSKSFKVGDTIDVRVLYNPVLGKESKCIAFFSPELSDDFCNVEDLDLDSAIPVKNEFNLSFLFETTGKKRVRGYIQEYTHDKNNPKNEKYLAREVYFVLEMNVIKN